MTDIIGATTAGISLAKKISEIVPVNGLSSITDMISGELKSIGSIFTKIPEQKFPLPNPLFAYASYTYTLGIAGLTDDDLHNPDTSYLSGKRLPLICKSANADPSNRVNTPYGRFDFFIDDVELESIIGFMKGFNTNVSKIRFKITEPYSMGLFIIAVQQLAQELGHDNWRDAPFLLSIDFKGNKETGQIDSINGTSKRIPFKFTDIEMTVTETGSVYTCKAMPYNQAALADNVAKFKSEISIKGKTVQEILQTGEKSLQAVVNQRYKQLVDQKLVSVADEILILFPQDVSSSSNADSSKKENNSSAVTDPANSSDSSIFKKLGVTRSTVNQSLVQDAKDCNVIGKASSGFNEYRTGTTPIGKENAVYDEKSGGFIRAQNTIDVKESDFKFAQDTDIPNAINQVLLQSDFIKDTFNAANLTAEGYRTLWRIDVQTYNLGSKETIEQGVKPKLYVYRVVPYNAHAGNMMPPNTKPPGYDNLKKQVVKEYNYIYTGKNVDVKNFEIKIHNGFSSVMAADGGRKSQDIKQAAEMSGKSEQSSASLLLGKGNAPSKELGVIPTIVNYIGTITGTDKKGGGGVETEATRAGRLFMDAVTRGYDLINLDMTIIGDPYFIVQSGMGNYTSKPTQYMNLNADGSVNYQNGEVVISVNFRTPIDINQQSGMYDFGGKSKTAPVMQYSGMYKIRTVVSTFNGGEFVQKLKGQRMPLQESKQESTPEQTFNTSTGLTGMLNDITKLWDF
jgi:hypothetical protein